MEQSPGHVTHTELVSSDADATCRFMGALFGVEFSDVGREEPYYAFSTEGQTGGIRPLGELPGAGATPYFTVADLTASVRAATSHGAKLLIPKQSVKEIGWFAYLKIPGDCVIALWQDDPNAP